MRVESDFVSRCGGKPGSCWVVFVVGGGRGARRRLLRLLGRVTVELLTMMYLLLYTD